MLLLIASESMARNLTILSRGSLENHELLDVYLHENLAFIPGGLGGLNIVDVSNPSNPTVLSNYHAAGCDWGRIYTWSVGNNYAFGTGRECGVRILDVSNPSNPIFVRNYTDPEIDEIRYEHGEVFSNTLFLSRHHAGIEVVDISNPTAPLKIATIPTNNAWASLATPNLLFIADGASGVMVISIDNISEPQMIASIQTSGMAKDVDLSGDFLFVAVGAAGVDMIDVSNPESPVLIDNYNTTGYASRVSANDSLVAVSDWDDMEVLDFSSGDLVLAGFKNTGGRVMALAMRDDIIFSAEWRDFVVFEFGSIVDADADVSTLSVQFPRVLPGSSESINLSLENNGLSTLNILPQDPSNSDFEFELEDDSIEPGDFTELIVTYTPEEGGSWIGDIYLDTNDPDEPSLNINLAGNHPFGPMIGDYAPEFELESVNGFGTISNETLIGQPTVLAFFTAW